jgi:1-deoxy-D-xylulose-5-phosphate synthase
MKTEKILNKINDPKDMKKLSMEQLEALASETRDALINKISKAGGHSGPNLGVVELTVALHYVFSSPKDKIIFDVSHQSYAHKILTGRKQAFLDEKHFHDVTGFTNLKESKHDMFTIGHTSTSISLALGVAKARDMKKEESNVVAIIGDGSLSGGEALEGLDYAGEYDKNLIIIVNDNDQSIAENHGGLYKSLRDLRESNGKSTNNIFKTFGLDYRYLEDGNDVEKLVKFFENAKDVDHPIVLHVHTIKGKGLAYAEQNREDWHAGGPFNVEDGSPKYPSQDSDTIIFDCITNLLDKNPKAVVLNAGTPASLGFTKDVRQKYVQRGQFVDVGIAEENAVAMASGIARNGGTAVFGTYAPFFQRTYDQISHDLCLNDSPATMILYGTGAYGLSSCTHTAHCDIQMFAHIPNFVYLAPANTQEFKQMFKFATTQKEHPVGIRLPFDLEISSVEDTTDYSILNKNKIEQKGSKVALFAVGSLIPLARKIAKRVEEKFGIKITIINPHFLSGLDSKLLEKLKKDHSLTITIEDGEVFGGYGQTIASYYGGSGMKVKNLGISKEFHDNVVPEKLLAESGISAENIVKIIKKNL